MHSHSFSTNNSIAPQVLIYATEGTTRHRRCEQLQRAGFLLQQAESFAAVKESLLESDVAVCLVEAVDGNRAIVEFYSFIQEQQLHTQLVCMIPESESVSRMTIPAARYDILESNTPVDRLRSVLFAATERHRLSSENRKLQQQLVTQCFAPLVCISPAMQQLQSSLEVQAKQELPFCLVGEQGTDFVRMARCVHSLSSRGVNRFQVFHVGHHTLEQMETELFSNAPESRIQLASGGSLLLDQVEAMPLTMQPALVRLIERTQRHDEQLGMTTTPLPRLILSLSETIETAFQSERIIPELYALLGGCQISVPPLRQRREDLTCLAENILEEIALQEGLPIQALDSSALHLIQTQFWLGNEAELRSILYKACSLNPGHMLTSELLRAWIGTDSNSAEQAGLTLKEMERKLIETTFTRFGGNREKTAQALQIGLRTLSGKLREYGYPPRGGPGSNIKTEVSSELRRAA
ncbi:C4-dicarboxylate transport transcriptional regulatory protein DctD [Polystyrenella longa]|uniref:C4-dicarboxylate transport transcriptional regulatory protein DctD n=1 Tax=Polystyrenella longa TaxID=2528007 RepID=A0A518CIP6_9PLAN|nr:sigma 54-interacting transcriptional regulator [Polystyrenella longa]QDU79109.1 C4-dicarboxylate transport transcriptional regulatory protein DctD [Polystyrenella longa]